MTLDFTTKVTPGVFFRSRTWTTLYIINAQIGMQRHKKEMTNQDCGDKIALPQCIRGCVILRNVGKDKHIIIQGAYQTVADRCR